MSRPYANINSATFNKTTNVVTLDLTAFRLRGQSTLTIGGFTQSQVISLSDGYYSNSSLTFSSNIDGSTSSTLASGTAFTKATAIFTFSGTASGGATKTNVKIGLYPSASTSIFSGGGYTFSATQSTETAVATLYSNITTLPAGVTASVSGNSLIFTAPANTGAFYNNNDAKILSAVTGTLGFTFSSAYYGGTWSGGVTTLTLPLSSTDFGTINDGFTFDVQ